MANKYLSYISDGHLLSCIENLYQSYTKAKADFSKTKFYSNKIDSVKLVFDSKFNTMNEEELIESEILRQIDKSINNSIGTFHEQILGGIKGFQSLINEDFNIKSTDGTLFVDIHFNPIKDNLSLCIFQKLSNSANFYNNSKIYLVDFFGDGSLNEKWSVEIGDGRYSHRNVYKITGEQLYFLLSGQKNALQKLEMVLPTAINDYLNRAKVKGKLVM